jgi:Asp/Glu/hydantoin racemase
MGAVGDSMNYALFAGERFDVNTHSEYVHTIIAMCIDTYAAQQQQALAGSVRSTELASPTPRACYLVLSTDPATTSALARPRT